MNKNRRNILIAVILLILLCVAPFWPNIKSAVTGTDTTTGATWSWGHHQETHEQTKPH